MYQLNQKTAKMINDLHTNPHIHIDDYWRTVATQKVPTDKMKYPIVANVIKPGLIIGHGNVDVETVFSISNNLLTQKQTEMSVETLNGLLSSKDTLAFHDAERQLLSSLPITKTLLQ